MRIEVEGLQVQPSRDRPILWLLSEFVGAEEMLVRLGRGWCVAAKLLAIASGQRQPQRPHDPFDEEILQPEEISQRDFLGVWLDTYGGDGAAATTLNFYWTARIVSGTPEAADDVAELRWFAPAEISEDDLAFPHTVEVLSALRRQQQA